MIAVDIPGYRELRLEHLVLDYNGTLAEDGKLLPGVAVTDGVASALRRTFASFEPKLASSSDHAGNARTRRKSSFVAASVCTPIWARRCSMTSASPGLPLRLCARASRYISAESFFGPVCTARHARS